MPATYIDYFSRYIYMGYLPTYISTHGPPWTPPSHPRFRGLHLINIAVCLALYSTDAMRCESTRLKRPDTRIIISRRQVQPKQSWAVVASRAWSDIWPDSTDKPRNLPAAGFRRCGALYSSRWRVAPHVKKTDLAP